ncbi:MAG: Uncharacterized protein AUREO_049590 [Aureobasidium pullulans]|nr:MAG: Uncharacterized protein AUREO_049590 [Aureobasidium pullulans]
MILHQLDQLLDFWQKLGDKSRKLVWISGGAVSRVLLRITVSLALVFVVLSFTYPISERAAGGNWNLRYLPAETRRFLRGITQPQTLITNYAIPSYAVMPDTPKSLYLQGAGFLYTDDWTWDDTMNLFRPLNNTEFAEETTPRASLRDSIRYTSPWTFQKAHTSDHAEGFLRDNELIYISSGDSGRYLAVEVGVPSIVDRVNFMYVENPIDPQNDGIRWTVSTIASTNEAATWVLEYSPAQSPRFRLWNVAANCSLATSYRSFPDWNGILANDTVLKGLRLELELTCLSDANVAASTWEIVDGLCKSRKLMK